MFLVGYIEEPLLVRKSVTDDMAKINVDNSIFFDKAKAYLILSYRKSLALDFAK